MFESYDTAVALWKKVLVQHHPTALCDVVIIAVVYGMDGDHRACSRTSTTLACFFTKFMVPPACSMVRCELTLSPSPSHSASLRNSEGCELTHTTEQTHSVPRRDENSHCI